MSLRKFFLVLAVFAFAVAPLTLSGCGPSGASDDNTAEDTNDNEANTSTNNGSNGGTSNGGSSANNKPPVAMGGFWKGVPAEVLGELTGESKAKAEAYNALIEEWGGEVKEKPDDETNAHVAGMFLRALEINRELAALVAWVDVNDNTLAAGFNPVSSAVNRQVFNVVGDRFESADRRGWNECELYVQCNALVEEGRYADAINAIGFGELLPEEIVGDDETARANWETAFGKWRFKFVDKVVLVHALDKPAKELIDAGEYLQAAQSFKLSPELEQALSSLPQEDLDWAMDNHKREMTRMVATEVGQVFAGVENVIYDLRSQLKDKEEAEKQEIIDDVLAQVDECIAEIDAWGLGPAQAELFAPPLDFAAEARKKKDSYIEYIDGIRG